MKINSVNMPLNSMYFKHSLCCRNSVNKSVENPNSLCSLAPYAAVTGVGLASLYALKRFSIKLPKFIKI